MSRKHQEVTTHYDLKGRKRSQADYHFRRVLTIICHYDRPFYEKPPNDELRDMMKRENIHIMKRLTNYPILTVDQIIWGEI